MGPAHLDRVLEIEEASFSNPWPREAFDRELAGLSHSRPLVLLSSESPNRVLGYCIRWLLFDEVHLQNLAIHPDYRGTGLGRYLLGAVIESARSQQASVMKLEVRRSNRIARRLYDSVGFRQVGERKGYYSGPREDAVLLEKRLLGTTAVV